MGEKIPAIFSPIRISYAAIPTAPVDQGIGGGGGWVPSAVNNGTAVVPDDQGIGGGGGWVPSAVNDGTVVVPDDHGIGGGGGWVPSTRILFRFSR